ncbi:MAG: histidine phosphatase family protein [Ruminococcaceae bacterium]|nr:histidine phosphatase family protein [Oscillospiraceae bacterium]
MKILFIRHADPNYEKDSLTEKGFREAELVTERLLKESPAAVYVSPMGRAQKTAKGYLQKTGIKPTVYPWLMEFIHDVTFPDGRRQIPWDLMPDFINRNPELYDLKKWYLNPLMQTGSIKEEYDKVADGIDSLLSKHGYERNGMIYKVNKANSDTVMIFCHFGVECVILSHMLNVSPVLLWQGFCCAPTGITTVYTEEREKGKAQFRVSAFGDISHLYAADEPPSFSARFCETYDNMEQRH